MTDTNDLRDSLKDAPQRPLDSFTLCGAIINRSYEEAHNHFHQAFHQTAYQPLASHAPDTTVQSCKICGILVNGSYEHAHNQVHQADYEPFGTASHGTLRPANAVASSPTGLPRRAQPRSRVAAEVCA